MCVETNLYLITFSSTGIKSHSHPQTSFFTKERQLVCENSITLCNQLKEIKNIDHYTMVSSVQ